MFITMLARFTMVSPLQWLSIGRSHRVKKDVPNLIQFQAGVHFGHGDAHVLDALVV